MRENPAHTNSAATRKADTLYPGSPNLAECILSVMRNDFGGQSIQ